MKDTTKDRIAYGSIILSFFILNYCIIGYGHSLLYKEDVYVCRHMAQDIEDMLESVGIPVKIITASNANMSKGHMWVSILGVEFDSVTLLPYCTFKYTENKEIYNDYQEYLDRDKVR